MANIRVMEERDLSEAARIVRVAFGTFLGAPEPENFWADLDYVHGRFGVEHTVAFAAEQDGVLAGSNFATRWGSVGFFGPLSIRPDQWNSGIGQQLVAAVCSAFDEWGVRHAGLCTFPHSTKHVWTYGKFGFHPRFLTAIMMAPAGTGASTAWSRYSQLPAGQREEVLAKARDLTDEIYPGLDLAAEVRTVLSRNLGDTVLVWDGDSRLAGFAVCHCGPATEAGAGNCFVKFGAARSGPGGEQRFGALLDACGGLAAAVGMPNVLAGVSTGREEAYRYLRARGFRAEVQVVTMHRPNDPGYNRGGVFVLDDWR